MVAARLCRRGRHCHRSAALAVQSFFDAQSRHSPETSTNFTSRLEGRAARQAVDRVEDAFRVDLLHGVAVLARQEDRAAAGAVVHAAAGEEGVLAFEAMDDAGFEQRVDGAVDGDGREPRALLGQLGEDVVGADRGVRRRDLLEHVLAQLGEAQVLFGKRLVGALDGFRQFAVGLGR